MAAKQTKDPEVVLTLKVSQVNMIIGSLDEVPHKYSRPIIDLITKQATEQLNVPEGPLSDKVID